MKKGELFVGFLILGFSFYLSSLFQGFLQDDAYIFARYAQHLADGDGFVYNKGEHTEGATSLLWTLMAALAAYLGVAVPSFLKWAGAISSLLWVFSFILVCKQWLKPYQWVFPVLLFCCFPSFMLWSEAGLEVSFFGFLTMMGFYFAERWNQTGHKKELIYVSILSSLLLLTRPEAPIVLILYVVFMLFSRMSNVELSRYFYIILVPVSFVFIGLFLFRYLYFHDIFPNTYYAKGGGGYYLLRFGMGKMNAFLFSNYTLFFFLFCLPLLFIRTRIQLIILIVPLWMAYYIKSGGDILPEHRLFLPSLPFVFLGSAFVFFYLWENHIHQNLMKWGYALFGCLICVFFFSNYYRYYHSNLSAYSGVIPALERAHGEVGRYLNTHMHENDKAILTDAGMTAFYAQDKYIVDWLGLCDKRVARTLYETGYNEWAMYYCYNDAERLKRKKACEAQMIRYFEEINPRYAVLNLYLKENADEMMEMHAMSQQIPDTLSEFALSRISFNGYFGVFTKENKGRNFKPIVIKPYHPYFWMILAERPQVKEKKPF